MCVGARVDACGNKPQISQPSYVPGTEQFYRKIGSEMNRACDKPGQNYTRNMEIQAPHCPENVFSSMHSALEVYAFAQ